MKTLLFSHLFAPLHGGVESFMASRAAAAAGDVSVLASATDGDARFDASQVYPVHRFPYAWRTPSWSVARRPLQLAQSYRALRSRLSREHFDVLETSAVFPGAVAASALPSAPPVLVSYAYGDDILRPSAHPLVAPVYRQVLRRISLLVTISRVSRQLLVEQGADPSKIEILHPPIDFEKFQQARTGVRTRRSLPEHRWMLLTVARLVPKKGIDRVIRLLPVLRSRFPGLLYVIGGEGESRGDLERVARESGVEENVHFLGRVADQDLPDLYAAADLFVMLTRADVERAELEGFGIVFREAGSQGTPAIGPRQSGASDAIEDGRTGLLVDAGEPEEAIEAISRLLGDADRRSELGRAARRLALTRPDWVGLQSRIAAIAESHRSRRGADAEVHAGAPARF